MKIVFVGAVEFSRHCLQETLRARGNVTTVIALDKESSSFHSDYLDLSETAESNGIPSVSVQNINAPETVQLMRSLDPDVIFIFGWSQLISNEVLGIPAIGCIGSHPALLPKNRGRHPIVWTLVEGLGESGLTFFYMDEGADSGDILWQRPFPVTMADDAGTLYEKIKSLASEAILEFLPQLELGIAPRTPQNHELATYWRKRTEKDGVINWEAPSLQTYNLVRALTRPYAGAHTYLEGEKVTVWKARLPSAILPEANEERPAGLVFGRSEAGLEIRTGDGHITIQEIEASNPGLLKIGARLGNTS